MWRMFFMARGGKREGAGRKKGTGKFGVPTKAIRVPVDDVDRVFRFVRNRFYRLPLFHSAVAAGTPSPAEDSIESELDLTELLIKHPSSTFYVRASGSSMIHAGIFDEDILVVDKSIKPTDGKIVVAAVNGEMTVKRLSIEQGKVILLAENEAFDPIEIREGMDFHIWGVVTTVLHQV
jgi:DNA polymerase V